MLSHIDHSLYVGVVEKLLSPPLTGEQYRKMENGSVYPVFLYTILSGQLINKQNMH